MLILKQRIWPYFGQASGQLTLPLQVRKRAGFGVHWEYEISHSLARLTPQQSTIKGPRYGLEEFFWGYLNMVPSHFLMQVYTQIHTSKHTQTQTYTHTSHTLTYTAFMSTPTRDHLMNYVIISTAWIMYGALICTMDRRHGKSALLSPHSLEVISFPFCVIIHT